MAPLSRMHNNTMPYGGTFINHNNTATAAPPSDGTHMDLTAVRPILFCVLCVFLVWLVAYTVEKSSKGVNT